MQQTNLFPVMILAVCLMALTAGQVIRCNRCMDNNIACVNQTHFKYCINYSPISDQLLYCGAGKVCTDMLCVNEGLRDPVCSDDDINCKTCDGAVLFVCTSRTTFQMCNGLSLTGTPYTCPTGTYCSINSGEFCVKACALPKGKLECNRAAP